MLKFLLKTISAVVAFVMLMTSGSSGNSAQKCNPEFNGTFIQSWMTCEWNDERWEKEMNNMKEAGIEYLILQNLADKSSESSGGTWTVYYDTDVKELEGANFRGDSLEPALRYCKKAGIKVFVGLNMFDDFWTQSALTKQYGDVCEVAADMLEDIYTKYGKTYAGTLYGWYFTPEISNGILAQMNIDGLAKGVNTVIDRINATDAEKPLLLSPFYSEYLSMSSVVTLANYVKFFDAVKFRDGDIFAPQDAVGAKWVREENLRMTWEVYKAAVDSCDADIKLWANCENFSSPVADSALSGIVNPPETENTSHVTETLDRFVWQMDVASRYAENIITFSYNHYYSPDEVNSAFIETYLDYVKNGYVLENEAPGAPAEFKKAQDSNGTKLTWENAVDNMGIAYYRIEKDGKFLARVEMFRGNEKTEYIDSNGRLANTYTITAFDAAGNCSEAVSIK